MSSTKNQPDEGYRKAFKKYGESPKGLQWIDYGSAAARYKQLVTDLDVDGRSIIDVGCGMGDLLPYLYAKSDSFKYVGVDIMPEFIEIAKKRYLGHNFQVLDPFDEKYQEKFDLALLSGALNSNQPNWFESRKNKIRKLYELSKEAAAFNMAGGLGYIPNDNKVAYANAQEILEFCTTLTSNIILRSHYKHYDFTIVMFK